ncbi:substrate-binding domain-containing protein [Streptomyces cinereospinus]|uniref:Substrate-binding domain-containing protein n=1 Tax=Streptomyces cinereospinus TaxID=285561 RepID=A0ABV5NBV8_9ACTN
MNVKSRMRIGAAVGAAALGLGVLSAPAAFADPNPTTELRQLAGAGSDTTQDVMNGLSEVVKDAGNNKIIASWNATGTTTITTKATPACTNIARPNGSSAGIDQLRAAVDNGTGCYDFARSSRGPVDNSTTDLSWIKYAKDAVTWAKRSSSALPNNLTTAQLKSIYECSLTSLNGVAITPILPQSNSGTRQFFLTSIGVATPGSCVQQGVQENDGRVLDSAGDIVPFSVAQYTAQQNLVIDDLRGAAVLRNINGVAPRTGTALNPSFPLARDVYNVVPTTRLTNATIASTFVGTGSKVCAQSATITTYGFGTLTDCGTVAFRAER